MVAEEELKEETPMHNKKGRDDNGTAKETIARGVDGTAKKKDGTKTNLGEKKPEKSEAHRVEAQPGKKNEAAELNTVQSVITENPAIEETTTATFTEDETGTAMVTSPVEYHDVRTARKRSLETVEDLPRSRKEEIGNEDENLLDTDPYDRDLHDEVLPSHASIFDLSLESERPTSSQSCATEQSIDALYNDLIERSNKRLEDVREYRSKHSEHDTKGHEEEGHERPPSAQSNTNSIDALYDDLIQKSNSQLKKDVLDYTSERTTKEHEREHERPPSAQSTATASSGYLDSDLSSGVASRSAYEPSWSTTWSQLSSDTSQRSSEESAGKLDATWSSYSELPSISSTPHTFGSDHNTDSMRDDDDDTVPYPSFRVSNSPPFEPPEATSHCHDLTIEDFARTSSYDDESNEEAHNVASESFQALGIYGRTEESQQEGAEIQRRGQESHEGSAADFLEEPDEDNLHHLSSTPTI